MKEQIGLRRVNLKLPAELCDEAMDVTGENLTLTVRLSLCLLVNASSLAEKIPGGGKKILIKNPVTGEEKYFLV